MPKDYLRKNVSFDPFDPREMELYEWLKSLPYGEFAERTKQFWQERMTNERINQILESGKK